jgi:hypothetical protein
MEPQPDHLHLKEQSMEGAQRAGGPAEEAANQIVSSNGE